MKSYFILSCARSGSTSLAHILNTAQNAICQSEPMPNLNVETRQAMDNKLTLNDIENIIGNTVVDRVSKFDGDYEIYGEKNVTFAPFITTMYEKLGCKFIYLIRDGRDAVSSMMNWNDKKFGNFYREAKDNNISKDAYIAVKGTHAFQDTSDYSRPRPQKGDALHYEWLDLDRFQMCTYYWTYINDLYAKELSKIPDDAYMVLDYTNVSAERIMQISEFLGLKGMDENIIQDMLNQKINSLENRGHASGDFPKWENWDSRLREQFDNIASDKMYKLGYYKDETTKWRPKGYGQFWSDAKGADNSWFEWMYESRINSHRNLIEFVLGNKEITSIADFGCGTAVGYSKAFEELKYTGVDISRENIEWCLSNRNNGNHSYICQDIVMEPLKEKADLVFSSGTIDNSYDVKAYIDSMIKSTNKWIYFTLYRGYFPNRDSISYSYNEEQKVYYNDIPVGVLRRYLEQAGCKYIDIRPEESSNNDIIYETRVIAHI